MYKNNQSNSFTNRPVRYGSRPSSNFGGGRSFGGAPRYGEARNSSFSNGGFRGRSGGYGYGAFPRGQKKTEVKKSDLIRSIMASKDKYEEVEKVQIQYQPVHNFADFPFTPQLQSNISKKGYVTPTPIQDQAIKPILEGKDVIGIANTGTGKTAAFLLPLIDKIVRNKGERVLIVAPTRELADQIYQEGAGFVAGLGLRAVLIIGGASMGRQISALSRNPEFVIGTPGRLKDLIEQRKLDLSQFSNVVLDEVDRMVDIGFIQTIKYLISLLPASRQSLFFSATVTGDTQKVLSSFVKDAVTISVKQNDTTKNIKQEIIKVVDKSKQVDQLHDLLNQKEFEKVIIFGRTKHGVQKLSDNLVQRGFSAAAIHGNKRQSQRDRTLSDFRSNHINILLATDVASRGLDIPDVTHVINYDLPECYEDYIHRIGRTGRANKTGVALTFIA